MTIRTSWAVVANALGETGSADLPLVGDDPSFRDQLTMVGDAADTNCTILISGESGTGKELVAKLIHRLSPRREGPLVAVNCAAIPESLMEAELLGHTRGAFTGAQNAREGRIVAAHKGTLFLDEIGDLPLSAQAKLLRILQDRRVYPVGSDQPIRVDIRVIAATNRDLHAMVERGEFRADLLYRLNVIQVELPPLRDRRSDILGLAAYFIEVTNRRTGRAVEGLDPEASRALLEHAWPGNVRELSNVIERAVILRRHGLLRVEDVRTHRPRQPSAPTADAVPAHPMAPHRAASAPPHRAASAPPHRAASAPPEGTDPGVELNLRSALEKIERQLINAALERSSGNRTEAAALLGLNRTTLVEKMRKLA
ncbi:MAG: sigma 54-interacting transcriptional regulator [Deltaproteobacteria bacterium]|nr:sigma 54-interacting transcriptional regulator [Deltaproteobacteria bacterium]